MIDLGSFFPAGSPGREAGQALSKRPALPPLLAGPAFDAALEKELEGLEAEALFQPGVVKNRGLAEGARSGLLLWNDSFEESHRVAQDLPDLNGSYWHGICHRREGTRGAGLQSNLDNARYWFRRVRSHPIYDPLYQEALSILASSGLASSGALHDQLKAKGSWDPALFIDCLLACESGQEKDLRTLLESIQAAEMKLLLEYCAGGAVE